MMLVCTEKASQGDLVHCTLSSACACLQNKKQKQNKTKQNPPRQDQITI